MDGIASSVDLPLPQMHGIMDSHKISPEDLQTVSKMYQSCPHLRTDFNNVVEFLNLLKENAQAYKQLFQCLVKMMDYIEEHSSSDGKRDEFLVFLMAIGFVEQAVEFTRQILIEMGKKYITAFPDVWDVHSSFDIRCLHLLRSHLLNCTSNSSEFRLRLAQTGFLQDLVEDLKHIRHLSAEALEKGKVFLLSLGIIHNCCRHPTVVSMVKQMDIVHHIYPFLGKRSESHLVNSVALMTLSHIVDDHQMDLIRLDAELLQFFLNNIRAAVSARKAYDAKWVTAELLHGLSLLARNDFNKRLIVAQGAMGTLMSVLEPANERCDVEKQSVVSLVTQLVNDPVNMQVFKMDKKLTVALKALPPMANKELSKEVNDLIVKLDRHTDAKRSPLPAHLAGLLAEQLNMLTILDMDEVEYVLDQLKQLTTGKSKDKGPVSRDNFLQALTELVKDDVHRQQIMSMGGLDVIKTVLTRGCAKEQTQTMKVIQELTTSDENRSIIKNDSTLMATLSDLAQNTVSADLGPLAEKVLQTLSQ